MPKYGKYEVPIPDAVKLAAGNLLRDALATMPEGWGATLFMYQYGEGGALMYLSSAKREDVLKMLGEFLQRQTEDKTRG